MKTCKALILLGGVLIGLSNQLSAQISKTGSHKVINVQGYNKLTKEVMKAASFVYEDTLQRSLAVVLTILPGGAVSEVSAVSTLIDSVEVGKIITAIRRTTGVWSNDSKQPVNVLFTIELIFDGYDGQRRLPVPSPKEAYYFDAKENKLEQVEAIEPMIVTRWPGVR